MYVKDKANNLKQMIVMSNVGDIFDIYIFLVVAFKPIGIDVLTLKTIQNELQT